MRSQCKPTLQYISLSTPALRHRESTPRRRRRAGLKHGIQANASHEKKKRTVTEKLCEFNHSTHEAVRAKELFGSRGGGGVVQEKKSGLGCVRCRRVRNEELYTNSVSSSDLEKKPDRSRECSVEERFEGVGGFREKCSSTRV